MPTKTYSLKSETIKAIRELAKGQHRTQGTIVDLAVAAYAELQQSTESSISLPVKPVSAKTLEKIPGVRKGA